MGEIPDSHFKLNENKAVTILSEIKTAVSGWKGVAKALGISRNEIELIKKAFRV